MQNECAIFSHLGHPIGFLEVLDADMKGGGQAPQRVPQIGHDPTVPIEVTLYCISMPTRAFHHLPRLDFDIDSYWKLGCTRKGSAKVIYSSV